MRFEALAHWGIGTFKLNSRALEWQDICMKVKDGKIKDRQSIVGAKCTGNGGVFDTAQLWTIGGSTPPPPSNPCGMPCNDDWECDSNKCGVGGTRCAGHCWKKGF